MMGKIDPKEFNPSPRILLGPGPGNVHYRVYQAMATPVIGYLDPLLLSAMDEISAMLRDLFQTKNRMTLALPRTGSSGMEASFLNFVEPGDTVVIFVKGYFGERMTEMAARFGAKVVRIDQEWGKPFEPERGNQGPERTSRGKDLCDRSRGDIHRCSAASRRDRSLLQKDRHPLLSRCRHFSGRM